ncbi:MAG: LacI family DNA-binding transcriptional regulator [Flavobacteriaceae bacterium]|nr:LacI family DNA-binding transcriptional regulator [Flavobacteriaceae bacterium]
MKNYNKKKPTVQDIANAIDISASTVSRALNNHPKISQSTKEKVWEAAKKLGYQPNIPPYMDTNKTKTICFMVPDLNTPFYRDVIKSIQQYYLKKGYNLYIAFTNNSLEIEEKYASSLVDLNIKGVIVALFDKSSETSHLNQLLNQNIPTVFINKTDHTPNSCKIIPDISNGAYKAVNHFISMKCKNIAVFTGNTNNSYYADIIDGYTDAMTEAGLNNEKNIFSNTISEENIYNRLDKLLEQNKLPDAILSPSITVTNQIINWIQKNNLRVPKDVLLVSFSSDTNNNVWDSTLSIIQFSGSEIGKKAAENLFQQIKKGPIIDKTIIIPPKFIIKNSSLRIK